MKIDLAIHSSDSNPFYLDFWPLVSKVWKLKFDVTPVLVYIDENHDIPIDTTYGIVLKYKPIPGIPVYLQCLWVRYWIPSQYPDKVSIISDIDMFPISRKYFVHSIALIPDYRYVHLNPDTSNFPSCYHVALGSTFVKVLRLAETWTESMFEVYRSDAATYEHTVVGSDLMKLQKWGLDEAYATQRLHEYPDRSIFVLLKRNRPRLDRSDWTYTEDDFTQDLIADSHSIRPYQDHKEEIDKLVDLILKSGLSRVYYFGTLVRKYA
jgi:hypothetical protein